MVHPGFLLSRYKAQTLPVSQGIVSTNKQGKWRINVISIFRISRRSTNNKLAELALNGETQEKKSVGGAFG